MIVLKVGELREDESRETAEIQPDESEIYIGEIPLYAAKHLPDTMFIPNM